MTMEWTTFNPPQACELCRQPARRMLAMRLRLVPSDAPLQYILACQSCVARIAVLGAEEVVRSHGEG